MLNSTRIESPCLNLNVGDGPSFVCGNRKLAASGLPGGVLRVDAASVSTPVVTGFRDALLLVLPVFVALSIILRPCRLDEES